MIFKRCPDCGLVRRVPATQITCDALRFRRPGRCLGQLAIDTQCCHAVIFHGPGHQSTSRCILPDDGHDTHTTGDMWFEGGEAMTDYFDEPPELGSQD